MSIGPFMMDVAGHALDNEDRRLLQHELVGGVILFSRNYASRDQLASLCREILDLRPELLLTVDYEGGRVQRFRDGFTVIPPMGRVGQLYAADAERGLEMAELCGQVIAGELAEFGIDQPLTPVVDLDYGCCDVIGNRAFSADPAATLALAQALRRGLNAFGMGATAKHFPGHGAVVEDSHHELPVDKRSLDALAADMSPYRALAAAGLESIMMAHIRYPVVDAAPASLSRLWIEDILRTQLGFAGAVYCDDLSMGGAAAVGDYAERAAMALEAGCDILPVCNNREAMTELLSSFNHPACNEGEARRAALKRKTAADSSAINLSASVARLTELDAQAAELERD